MLATFHYWIIRLQFYLDNLYKTNPLLFNVIRALISLLISIIVLKLGKFIIKVDIAK